MQRTAVNGATGFGIPQYVSFPNQTVVVDQAEAKRELHLSNARSRVRDSLGTPVVPSETQGFEAIDAEQVMNHIGFDKSLLVELVEIFREYYPEHMKDLNDAVERDDCNLIHETAHQLKSAVGNFFATKALKLVTNIELAGIQGRSDLAKESLALLPAEVDQMLVELPKLYEDASV